MTTTTIRRAEAAARALMVDNVSLRASVDLTSGAEQFRLDAVLTFTATTPGAVTWVDLIVDALDEATLNGQPLDVAAYDGARLALPGLAPSNELIIAARGGYVTTCAGLHRFVDPADGTVYCYTNCEPTDARRWLPVFEQPDIKATLDLRVRADATHTVLSHARGTRGPDADNPDAAWWEFPTTPPLPAYLMALAAGPFHAVTTTRAADDPLPVGVYCRASLAEHLDAEGMLTVTRQGLDHFEAAFGVPYPFACYDQVFVPEFTSGAMENPGCITFGEEYLYRGEPTDAEREARDDTLLHEMAHMWFGDLVTMAWWDDLWLNESFAEWACHYVSVVATRYTDAWATFTSHATPWAFADDQRPSSHPVAPAELPDTDMVASNFDGITYAKGAAVLHQLVATVGEKVFLAAVGDHLRDHAWGTATFADLLAALERRSGRRLDDWANRWLRTPGVTTLGADVTVEAGRIVGLRVTQQPAVLPEDVPRVLRPHTTTVGLYDATPVGLRRRRQVPVHLEGAAVDVPELIGETAADLVLVDDDALTYARLRLDPGSWVTTVESLRGPVPPLVRARLLGVAWDLTRDGELAVSEYLAVVADSLAAEPSAGAMADLTANAQSALAWYVDPGDRAELSGRVADAARAVCEKAPATGDRHRAALRAFLACAATGPQLDILAAGISGREVAGTVLDVDRRWTALQTLAAAGRLFTEDVDAAAAADRTAAGEAAAAYTRAALADPAAKEAAWTALTSGDLPSLLLEATIAGFNDVRDPALLAGFAARYPAMVHRAWADLDEETADTLTSGLFPRVPVSPEAVSLADGLLGDHLDPTARRRVAEGRDDVLRALRIRGTSRR